MGRSLRTTDSPVGIEGVLDEYLGTSKLRDALITEFRERLARFQLLGFGHTLSRIALDNLPQLQPWRDGLSGVRECLRASVGSTEASDSRLARVGRIDRSIERQAEPNRPGHLVGQPSAHGVPSPGPLVVGGVLASSVRAKRRRLR
jgi:hypothetical protein